MAREWLIRKRGMYYRPDRAGYTSSPAEAGRYTHAEALREVEIEPWNMTAIHQNDVRQIESRPLHLKGNAMTNRLPGLGDKVRCKITGFQGIVSAHSRHIAGCDRLWILPPVGTDNKPGEGMWLDIDMVEITAASAIEPITYTRTTPGGVDLPAPR